MSKIIALFHRRKPPSPTAPPQTFIEDVALADLPVLLPTYDQLIALADHQQDRYPQTAFYLRQAAQNLVHEQEHVRALEWAS